MQGCFFQVNCCSSAIIQEKIMSLGTTYNPLNTDGFEFIEFTAADERGIDALDDLFISLGFAKIAEHHSKKVWLYKQGGINFILNAQPSSRVESFARLYGSIVCGIAFRVKNAKVALEHAVENGAKPFEGNLGPVELNRQAVHGIGETSLYFVDRYDDDSIYDIDFNFAPNWQQKMQECGVGLHTLDYLSHNVKRGNGVIWANFYERLGNFREVRFCAIEDKPTTPTSIAMSSPCGKIRIPITESSDDKSQIKKYIRKYNAEGIPHIALSTDDIDQTVKILRAMGVDFVDTPVPYFNGINEFMPKQGEDHNGLNKLDVLRESAAKKDGIRLHLFVKTGFRGVFFEIIQRKSR
tara:strand:- start:1373 stop:2428 length:1056 start_codon:yes stop_codon:yes gene_type:complete